MVTHTRNLCSAFNPFKCTHTLNTHTQNTQPEQWAANAVAPGEQLGVRCLAQGSHLSRGIEGGESAGYSLPPPTIPAGPETRTRDFWVTSPTLYPLGHDCPLMFVMLCVIYFALRAAVSLLITCIDCQLSSKITAHLNSHKDAFCVLASFLVHSFKAAWQDRSPREHKSVLCILGIEKSTTSFFQKTVKRQPFFLFSQVVMVSMVKVTLS